jgi:hypothetical protein
LLTTQRLELKPSRRLALLLAALYLTAAASVSVLPISPLIKLPGILMIAWAATVSIRHHALLMTAKSFQSLVLLTDGGIEALRVDGECLKAEVSPQSTLFPWLVVLLLKTPARRSPQAVLILPDSLTADELRKLRSWLRLRTG